MNFGKGFISGKFTMTEDKDRIPVDTVIAVVHMMYTMGVSH